MNLPANHSPTATSLNGLMILLIAAALVLPVGLTVSKAFSVDGQEGLNGYWFTRLVEDGTAGLLLNGLGLAALTTGLCLVMSVPLALLAVRCRFAGQGMLSAAVLVPLILPPFVGALAMRQILGQYGTLNMLLDQLGIVPLTEATDWLEGGLVTVAVLQALHLFPILYMNATAALANMDPSHTQAARNLGAGPVRTFFAITLPLIKPGLFAGGTIVFIWSFTDIGTPLILNVTDLLPIRIFQQLTGDATGKTYAAVVVLLAVSIGLYIVGKFVFGRARGASGGRATLQATPKRLGALGTLGAWSLFGCVIAVALLPHAGVVLNAFSADWFDTVLPAEYTTDHLAEVIRDEDTYNSIVNSLKYASASTGIDLVLGTLIAWLLVRGRGWGKGCLDAMAMLPLAVPGLILAAGYVALTAPGQPLHSIGPGGNHPAIILIVAYAVRRLPFVVRGVSAGLQQVPESFEEAARTLGATPTRAARKITLPLIAANLIAAAVLTFAFAVLEVSDSLVLAQTTSNYPITKQIFRLFTSGTAEAMNLAAALGVYGMILLGGTMAIATALLGKKLGAIFRA